MGYYKDNKEELSIGYWHRNDDLINVISNTCAMFQLKDTIEMCRNIMPKGSILN